MSRTLNEDYEPLQWPQVHLNKFIWRNLSRVVLKPEVLRAQNPDWKSYVTKILALTF